MRAPTKIDIATDKGRLKVKHKGFRDHTGINKLADFLADNPNLIDVFSLATNLAEHRLMEKPYKRKLTTTKF